jgi:hypothetical protein
VQVHYDEGVAIYIGPEPCVGVREDGDEASVGCSSGLCQDSKQAFLRGVGHELHRSRFAAA